LINIDLNILKSCSSTNDIAKKEAIKGSLEGSSYLSYAQSNGRGRNKNKWESLEGNLFLSSIFRPKKNKIDWHQLSLLIGYSILETLIDFGINRNLIELKWPNDVLIDNKKISGILLEAFDNFIIVGIGLNVVKTPQYETKWKTTKINDYIKNKMSLEQISYKILNKIFFNYFIWQDEGFSYFKNRINKYIRNREKKISLTFNSLKQPITGVFLGLGNDGCLQVQVENNILDYYSVETITFPVDDLL
tara:strand:+ start:212 stop:952 length:741 start_codon:yes stop_codon:yes gene_type:complete